MTFGENTTLALCNHHKWAPYGKCAGCDELFADCLAVQLQNAIDAAVRDGVKDEREACIKLVKHASKVWETPRTTLGFNQFMQELLTAIRRRRSYTCR
jgi:hypothetical protein